MALRDEFAVFIERPPSIRIEDGMVYIDDFSGNLVLRRVMSLSTFTRTIRDGFSALEEWRISQSGKVERLSDWREDGEDDADQATCS